MLSKHLERLRNKTTALLGRLESMLLIDYVKHTPRKRKKKLKKNVFAYFIL